MGVRRRSGARRRRRCPWRRRARGLPLSAVHAGGGGRLQHRPRLARRRPLQPSRRAAYGGAAGRLRQPRTGKFPHFNLKNIVLKILNFTN